MSAGGQSLRTTYLDVEAPAAKPFALAVASGCSGTLDLANPTTGSGCLSKKGAGTLVVSGWSGTAKLVMSEGRIQAPAIDTYQGGTIVVSEAAPTTVGDIEGGRISVAVTSVPETGRAKVLTLPAGYAGTVEDATDYKSLGRQGILSVDGRDVYVGRPDSRTTVLVR